VIAAFGLVVPAAGATPPKGRSGKYIVMLKPSVGDPAGVAEDQTDRPGASLGAVFGTLKGYAATFRADDINAVQRDPRTLLVARDDTVRAMDVVSQSGAPFGVDRVDQRFRPLDNAFQANHDGAGVRVYVIDTGIRATHSEFGGRVLPGPNFVNDGRTTDCDGHGTHVAGIIGGSTYGVAKAVKLVPVRALDCRGSASTSTVISAINWVAANAQLPAVANMSLGGSSNSALDAAVQAAIGKGVAFSIAAGNGNFFGWAANACNTSPARVRTPGAMTIGATDANDAKASFSNYGDCVDWFAPGVNIKSSWYSSDTATQTLSGTSMAAPDTAGVAALYLDAHPGVTPAQLESGLLTLSQLSAVATNSRTISSHSHIVFTGRGRTDGGEVL
jgi:subtilisin family serine protease